MDVRLIPYKIKQRLNKKDSSDYENLHCHQIVEAYNKAQLEWSRRQLHGTNTHTEGAESTITSVDDLQILLTPVALKGYNRDYYFITTEIPENYLRYNLLRVWGNKKNCTNQRMKSSLREEANSEDLLRDKNSRPDFNWRDTFHTLVGNKFKVYTDGQFTIPKVELTYYRKPKEIRIIGCDYLGTPSSSNVNPEFKDDIVEIIIDEAASILAGDMESVNQFQVTSSRGDKNT